MKIIHHNDNDGYCSAAVVDAFLTDMFNNPTEKDFYVYSYNSEFNRPEVIENETVYIVDVAMDDRVYSFIEYCVSVGAKVIHIDHHKTTIEWIESHPGANDIIDKIISFYEIGVSASLMTYAYSCMNNDERLKPNDVNWGDNDTGNSLHINNRNIYIPLSVQYVNDYDVWNWKFGKDTSYFQLGLFMAPYNNKPFTKEWKDLVTNDAIVTNLMLDGEIAYRYRNRLFGIALRKGFISSLNNKAWCVVNSDFADSQLYGEFVDQFDICCCVQYYGDKWVYHIRSSELNDIDVSAIAKEHGGGGHKHASGFSDDGSFFKELLNTKIKTMNDFIDAYEAAKRELEEEAKREEEEKERQRAMKLRENFLKGIK